nr:MAG TPA: replisome organizer [Caudoviricetes sp.]
MTEKEVRQLLAMTQAVYPNYNPPSREAAVNAWLMCLSEYDNNIVMAAFKAYMTTDTSGFAPSIGQLVDKLHAIQNPRELTELEAWSLVSKAIRNGLYGADEEFAKLPPLVQQAVGQPRCLTEWAMLGAEDKAVMQSNFMRSYRAVVCRAKELSKMPPEVRALIEKNNANSYSAQITSKNLQRINSMLEDRKSKENVSQDTTDIFDIPKDIKERIEKLRK